MTILTPILICLAVAAILGALWLFAPEAALQATISVGVIAALGNMPRPFVGRTTPKTLPDCCRKPVWRSSSTVY